MNWTEEEYKEFMDRRQAHKPTSSKTSKYHAKKVEKYGRTWDSRKELAEYENLLLLQRLGEVTKIELQPKYVLQEAYVRDGKKIRELAYIADFRVTMTDGSIIVIDVKSKATEKNKEYRIKRKLLLYKYRDIDFREIL